MDQGSNAQCIICMQHFEPHCGALCSSASVQHFVCDADLSSWVWSNLCGKANCAAGIPCPQCNASFNESTLTHHIADSVFERYLERKWQWPQCSSCGTCPADPGDRCDDVLAHDDGLCWRGAGEWAQAARELAASCTAPHARKRGHGTALPRLGPKQKRGPGAAVG
jgi:hypothetical protein